MTWDPKVVHKEGWRVVLRSEHHDGDRYTAIGVTLKRSLRAGLWASTMPPDSGDERPDMAFPTLPEFWRVRAFDERWARELLEPLATILTRRSTRGRELTLTDERVELWCSDLEREQAIELAVDLAKRVELRADEMGRPRWEKRARKHWRLYAERRGLELDADALVMSGTHRAPLTYRRTREWSVRIEGSLRYGTLHTRVRVTFPDGAALERRYAGIAHDAAELDSQIERAAAEGELHMPPTERTPRPRSALPRAHRNWFAWAVMLAAMLVLGARRSGAQPHVPSKWLAHAVEPAAVVDPHDCNAFCHKAQQCGGDRHQCLEQCPDMPPNCRECLADASCASMSDCQPYCEPEPESE